MYDLVEAIDIRRSVRKFEDKCINEEDKEEIQRIITSLEPIESEVDIHFELIEQGDLVQEHFGGLLDRYFKVKAPAYIAISAKESEHYLENVGYMGEALVLELTRLKIGTCWVGSIGEDNIPETFKTPNGHKYIITIAIGYTEDDFRWEIEPDRKNRKTYEDFVTGDYEPDMIPIFKSIEKSPSSLNSQPWEITAEGLLVHFYLQNNNIFTKNYLKELNYIDLGIAMKHFETEMNEIGKEFKWQHLKINDKETRKYIYTANC